jgi:hypothetical protein
MFLRLWRAFLVPIRLIMVCRIVGLFAFVGIIYHFLETAVLNMFNIYVALLFGNYN